MTKNPNKVLTNWVLAPPSVELNLVLLSNVSLEPWKRLDLNEDKVTFYCVGQHFQGRL